VLSGRGPPGIDWPRLSSRPGRSQLLALLALFSGALAIGSSGIFVRLSETGPTATGFWRGALALPFLAAWAWMERRWAPPKSSKPRGASFFLAGVLFAGDLALWHWSLMLTSVAASTLEANLAPMVVTLIAWLAWRERPRPGFVAALGFALVGVVLILSPKLGQGGRALFGDLLGLGTACFYGSYIVVVSRLRSEFGAGTILFRSTLVFSLILLPLAVTEKLWPDTARGWAVLIGLALVVQALGQGLIAYALAHLSATFGSVGLYLQAVAAAAYAWLLLGETLTPVQILGAVVVLVSIAAARAAQSSASS
jgi:drug/metabolite transporter (DMT)-like permease